MPPTLEVLFTPAEFAALARRDLASTTCVVFDVLRATTTMITALANGASAIIPVGSIADALAARTHQPGVLLGGERHGRRIRADLSGGVDFDLGNSPREYTADKVRGRAIVVTTTNGTRALRACAKAGAVLISGFVNLRATAAWLERRPPAHLVLICSGTGEGAAWEDTLAAGALCDRLPALLGETDLDDSVQLARELFRHAKSNLAATLSCSRNARRLLAIPELRDDVRWCLDPDRFDFVAGLDSTGAVRRLN